MIKSITRDFIKHTLQESLNLAKLNRKAAPIRAQPLPDTFLQYRSPFHVSVPSLILFINLLALHTSLAYEGKIKKGSCHHKHIYAKIVSRWWVGSNLLWGGRLTQYINVNQPFSSRLHVTLHHVPTLPPFTLNLQVL